MIQWSILDHILTSSLTYLSVVVGLSGVTLGYLFYKRDSKGQTIFSPEFVESLAVTRYLHVFLSNRLYMSKLFDWFVLFPLTSAFLANWHRYILFSGKKPWKYFPIDFSKYTFQWIWTSIKVTFVFFVLAAVFFLLVFQTEINFLISMAIYILIFIIYVVRVSLIFPATAAQHDNSFTRAFKMSKNNFWSLLLVYVSVIPIVLVWFLLLMLMEFTVSSESSIAINLFYHFITFAFIFIIYGYLASCLSESYKVLSKK